MAYPRQFGDTNFNKFRHTDMGRSIRDNNLAGTNASSGTICQPMLDNKMAMDAYAISIMEPLCQEAKNKQEIGGLDEVYLIRGTPEFGGVSVRRFGGYELITKEPPSMFGGTDGWGSCGTTGVPDDGTSCVCCEHLIPDYDEFLNYGTSYLFQISNPPDGCLFTWKILSCSINTGETCDGNKTGYFEGGVKQVTASSARYYTPSPLDCWKTTYVAMSVETTEPASCNDANAYGTSGARLQCKDNFEVTVHNDCDFCLGNEIQGATSVLDWNESIDLSVSGDTTGHTYTWQLEGCGTLSPTSGTSTTYTAPDIPSGCYNLCGNGPIIRLICDGYLISQVQLLITLAACADLGKAYELWCGPILDCVGAFRYGYCGVIRYEIDCCGHITGSCEVGHYDYTIGACIQDCSGGAAGCGVSGSVSSLIARGLVDLRSESKISAGCCPVEPGC
jgi:hypothetical protein